MRLGCLGCLVLALIALGLGIVIAGGLIFSSSIFELPEKIPTPDWTAAEGQRAQQRLFEIARRETRQSVRTEPLFFTQREINAFLARHLDEAEAMPFDPLLVTLEPGVAVIEGKTQLKALLRGVPFNYLPQWLPGQTARPVWVSIKGRVSLEHGRIRKEREFLKIEVIEFRIGNLDAGTWFLSWMLGPRLLRWPVPKVIEEVTVEQGRLIITTGSA